MVCRVLFLPRQGNQGSIKMSDHYRLLSKNIPKKKALFFEVECGTSMMISDVLRCVTHSPTL